ncbi:MAG TPA: hypothetical protein VE032_00945 [Actinomycetota bacterium]|nr:hypothetical protein [Actinomycetota bacterium]
MTIAFRIVAGVFGVLFTVAQVIFVVMSVAEMDGQQVHVVHNLAGFATTTMLAAIPLVLLAWRPRQVALLRLVVAAGLATLIGGLLSGVLVSYLLIGLVPPILLLALSHDRREVFRLGAPVIALLAIAIVAAVPAVMEAVRQGDLQGGHLHGDEHIEQLHYAGMAVGVLALLLGAAWSAFPARAARTARDLVGLGGAFLGASSLAYPDAVGAFDTGWAVAVLVLGVLYLAISEIVARRAAPVRVP